MAKVINSNVASEKIIRIPSNVAIIVVGLIAGILHIFLGNMMIGRGLSIDNSANVVSILICLALIIAGLVLKSRRPILISVLTTVSLWNIFKITSEFDFMTRIILSGCLYMVGFLFYNWIASHKGIHPIYICGFLVCAICYLISV